MHHLLTLPAGPGDRELLALRLWELGAVGIEELDGHLRAAFDRPEAAARARSELAPLIDTALIDTALIERVPDDVGWDADRDRLDVVTVGSMAVHPPWVPPPAGRIGVVIDPGRAFGSGSHPSTRLALALLQDTAPATGARVLDVGCGSGVLTVAAARLGATVTAVDTDPAAVAATRANVRLNGLALDEGDPADDTEPAGGTVRVGPGSADAVTGTVDLALVNVTVDVHEAVAEAVVTRARRVVAAGILCGPQEARTTAAYRATVAGRRVDGEWVGLLLDPG